MCPFLLTYFALRPTSLRPTSWTTCSIDRTDCPNPPPSGGGEQCPHHLGELALHHRGGRRQVLSERARAGVASGGIQREDASQEIRRRWSQLRDARHVVDRR